MALATSSLSDITAKAKDQWKKKKNQKPTKPKQNGNKSKSKPKQKNKKRSIKQMDKSTPSETAADTTPPSKKRKMDKKDLKIDYNLPLKEVQYSFNVFFYVFSDICCIYRFSKRSDQ